MSKLDEINADMNQCQRDIDAYNGKIKELEKRCNKLIEFGERVKSSQGNFSTVLSSDKKYLGRVSTVAKSNKVAKNYKEGMNSYISNTGNKVVTNVYGKLIDRINSETVKLINRIDDCKANVSKCNNKMNRMKDDYKKEKKKEEEEKKKKNKL